MLCTILILLVLIGHEMNIIKWIQTILHLIVISTDDQLCQEVNDIFSEYNVHVFFFTYDTTFNIGEYFVTPTLSISIL